MKTDVPKKSGSASNVTTKSTRRTLKVIQVASDKENLVGRQIINKDAKLASETESRRKKYTDKSVQTEDYAVTVSVTVEDLTSDEQPSENYWKTLAEKRGEQLDRSLQENEHLKENIETLQEENRLCKEMLDESKTLIEVLQEMISESDGGSGETPETSKACM